MLILTNRGRYFAYGWASHGVVIFLMISGMKVAGFMIEASSPDASPVSLLNKPINFSLLTYCVPSGGCALPAANAEMGRGRVKANSNSMENHECLHRL